MKWHCPCSDVHFTTDRIEKNSLLAGSLAYHPLCQGFDRKKSYSRAGKVFSKTAFSGVIPRNNSIHYYTYETTNATANIPALLHPKRQDSVLSH